VAGGLAPLDIDVRLLNGIIGGRADAGGRAPTGIIGRAFRVGSIYCCLFYCVAFARLICCHDFRPLDPIKFFY